MRPALPFLSLALAALAGCGDSVVRNTWTSYTVIQAEAVDPLGAPVEGVVVRAVTLSLTCDDLRVGSLPGDSVRTDASGVGLLGISVESGPLGDACVGFEVRAPASHVLDGPEERELDVRFGIAGQQAPAVLELLLEPVAPVATPRPPAVPTPPPPRVP